MKTTRKPSHLLLALLAAIPFQAFSQQATINFIETDASHLKPSSLINLTIVNPGSQEQRVCIEGDITEPSKGIVLKVRSEFFNLHPGTNQIQPGKINLVYQQFTDLD